MSYRDLRNFTEMMRTLGYPRHISMENFRTPNFPLVTEILIWLIKRYDPNAGILENTEKEADRVAFIKSVAHFLASKAHIKVNTKKLYQADGYAVKELLKVASLMYEAMKSSKLAQAALTSFGSSGEGGDSEEDAIRSSQFDIRSKSGDINLIRELGKLITEKGAQLYDLLEREVELKQIRQAVINKPLDIEDVNKNLHKAMQVLSNEYNSHQRMLDNVATDEASLESKIASRQEELERQKKRLNSIRKVRPAFMDEYERFESELEEYYKAYIIKFRNLTYLESQLEDLQQVQQQQIEDFDQRVEKSRIALMEEGDLHVPDDDNDDSGTDLDDLPLQKRMDRPSGARQMKPKRGVMYAGGDDDDDGASGDSDDDSDDGDSLDGDSDGEEGLLDDDDEDPSGINDSNFGADLDDENDDDF